MLLNLYVVAVVICVPCIYYLMMSAMEKDEFFLTHYLAKWLFPRLDRNQRHRRLEFIAGLLVAIFLTAATIAFLINRFGRG